MALAPGVYYWRVKMKANPANLRWNVIGVDGNGANKSAGLMI